MKAAPFAYVRPATVGDAAAALAAADGGGKVISGGQSLMPVLAMRLARPDTLVDINAVAGLDRLTRDGDWLHIGATVRQRQVERHPDAAAVPLLGMALPWVGHRELRSRGTVCGSLAHADPAAELPAVACCLGATLTLTGPGGARQVPAEEFFTGAMTTALHPDEILTAARFPCAAAGDGYGFGEIARRHGDFALAGVAVHVRSGAAGCDATLTAFGVSDRPVSRGVGELLAAAVAAAGDRDRLPELLAERVRPVTDGMVDTEGDTHASPAYRRRLLAVLAGRELARAHHRAGAGRE